jgi:hypothetical protein
MALTVDTLLAAMRTVRALHLHCLPPHRLCVAVLQKSAAPNFGSSNKVNTLSRHRTSLTLKGGRFSAA